MTRPAFVRQWGLADGSKVLSATNEAGLLPGTPVAGDSNTGRALLRASGVPLASAVYNLALQRGGNMTGYWTTDTTTSGDRGVPGASLRYKGSSDASSEWRGFNDSIHQTYSAPISIGSAGTDYPGVSAPRALRNGAVGFARTKRAGTNLVQFCYKSSRVATYTLVTIATEPAISMETGSAPAICVLASGRILCAYLLSTGLVRISYSDDHGATWAAWSTDTGVALGASPSARQLSLEVAEEAILLLVSMHPGAATVDASVYWSWDGGQGFVVADTPTWGPTRTCVTATGVILAAATDQSTTSVSVYQMLPGTAPGAALSTVGTIGAHATASVLDIVTRDDGTIWAFGGGNFTTAPLLQTRMSRDHGVTWQDPQATGSAATVWSNGINTATPRGFRQVGIGEWQGRLVVIGVTNGTSANRDDSNVEIHLGGWDSLTEGRRNAVTEPYSSGSYAAIEIPDNEDWVKTDAGAGATITLDDDGLNIVQAGVDASYYTAPATFFATGTYTLGWRWKFRFRCNSGGSLADDRAVVAVESADGGGNISGVTFRFTTDQCRLVDQAGNTLATSAIVLNQFTAFTEVLIALDATGVAGGTVSAWYRGSAATHWTNLASAVAITETAAAATRPRVGGIVAGAVDWDFCWLAMSPNDLGLSAGFTNPTSLTGRPIDPAFDFNLTNGVRVGGASGGGVAGDTFTLTTTASFAASWVMQDIRPSAAHRSTADNATHAIVIDAAANTTIGADYAALVGTNFRTATVQMHTADSWATPSVAVNLDATVWSGTISTSKRGLGYVGVDGTPWLLHQWRSQPGRKYYLQVGSTIYSIDDCDTDVLYSQGTDFSAASGTIYVFGDRMGAALPGGPHRYRYARALVSAQQTVEDYYQIGTFILGRMVLPKQPYANGFVWSLLDPSAVSASEAGYESSRVLGPQRRQLRIAWDPVDRGTDATAEQLAELWRALRGRHEPVLFCPDLDRPFDFGLYRVAGPFARENVYGEGRDALDRIAQLILTEIA